MRVRGALVFCAALLGLSGAAAGSETVVLSPIRDNTLFQDENGALSSGSGTALFVGNNSVLNTRRAVLAFDLEGGVPAGAIIDSVALVVNVSNVPSTGPVSVGVHRLLASWGEGPSVSGGGAGAPSDTGDATWLHRFYPDTFWSQPGGDFDPISRAVIDVEDIGGHTWAGSELAADVQGWLDNPSANFGWLLMGEESTAGTARRIDSREHPTENRRPALFVYFTPSQTPTRSTTWGRLKIGSAPDPISSDQRIPR